MKKPILVLAISIILFSCSKESDEKIVSDFELLGKWQLSNMGSSIPNSESTGSGMEWQEYYIFNETGTFLKHRERDNTITEVFGDYNLTSDSENIFIELIYVSDNNIIGSCYSNQKEELSVIKEKNNKMYSTWEACDGPSLEYDKVN